MKYALCRNVIFVVIGLTQIHLTNTFGDTQLFLKMKSDLRKILFHEKPGARRDILKGGEPNPGFEQYWPDMEHFYGITTERNIGTATVDVEVTTERKVCGGMPCPDIYIEYGHVCGKLVEADNITYKYYTFEDLCELEKSNCDKPNKWTVAYKGKCGKDFHPWIENGAQIVRNKVWHAYEFFERLPDPIPPATSAKPSNVYFNKGDYKDW